MSAQQIKIYGRPAIVKRSGRGYVRVTCGALYVSVHWHDDWPPHRSPPYPSAEVFTRYMDMLEADAIKLMRATLRRTGR